MKYLLIDTSIFVGSFVAKDSYSKSLEQISTWCHSGHITLLVPDVLEKEWSKHQIEERKKIEKSVNQISRVHDLMSLPDISKKQQNAIRTLNGQIDDINDLFDNYSVKISVSNNVKAKLFDLKAERKAPFHSKFESDNDAILILSCIENSWEWPQNKFSLITSNTNDFGLPENKNEKLHPGLIEIADGVEIDYFSSVHDFIKKMILEGLPALKKKNSSTLNHSAPDKKKALKFKNANDALSKIHKKFSTAYQDLSFIPTRILNSLYLNQCSLEAGFIPYKLFTNDDIVYNLFSSWEVSDEGKLISKNNELQINSEKFKFIIEKLKVQSLHYITHNNTQESLPQLTQEKCLCIRCRTHLFQFSEIDTSFRNEKETDFEFYFKRAFVFFNVCNYKKAYQDFNVAYNLAKVSNSELNQLRCEYNLIKLRIKIMNDYFLEESLSEELNVLKQIYLHEFGSDKTEQLTKELSSWLSNDQFIKGSFYNLSQIRDKITELNRNSHNNGYNSNSHLNELGFEYSQILLFIQANFIIYETFDEFENIVDCFIESVLASITAGGNSSKISHFNDWILYQFLKFGNFDKIQRHIRTYVAKDIEYIASNEFGEQITDKILNVLSNYKDPGKFLEFEDKYLEDKFLEKYDKWVENIFIILSLIKFEDYFIEKCLVLISEIALDSIDRIDFINLHYLLLRRKEHVTYDSWKQFLIAGHVNNNIIKTYHFLNVAEIGINNNFKVVFSKKEFAEVEIDLNTNRARDIVSIIHIWRITKSNAQKRKFIELVGHFLKEENTKYKIEYCIALLYGMLPFDKTYFDGLIALYSPKEPIQRDSYSQKRIQNYNGNLDVMIEVIYKFNLKLTKKQLTLLNYHSLYYQWLLNLEKFNYKEFDAHWITEHNSKVYNKRFKYCETLKRAIEEYLSKDQSLESQSVKDKYIEIYIKTDSN
ncbi:MAG: PIN domain-containing protein [Bacteroidota bacterium]